MWLNTSALILVLAVCYEHYVTKVTNCERQHVTEVGKCDELRVTKVTKCMLVLC